MAAEHEPEVSGRIVSKMTFEFKRIAKHKCKPTVVHTEAAARAFAVSCPSLRPSAAPHLGHFAHGSGDLKFSSQNRFFIEFEVVFFAHVGGYVFLIEVCVWRQNNALL